MTPKEQPQWLKDVVQGLVGAPTYSVVAENDRYAVIKEPGGMQYHAIGSASTYYPVNFILVKKGVHYWGGQWKTVWTGRLTKEGRKIIEHALEVMQREIEARREKDA